MRKKFLIFCETCEFEPLTDLLVDMDTPEKVRLSPVMTGYGGVVGRDVTEGRYATAGDAAMTVAAGRRALRSRMEQSGESDSGVLAAAVEWARTRERARTARQGYASAWRGIFTGY
jgi:hypothetical protein